MEVLTDNELIFEGNHSLIYRKDEPEGIVTVKLLKDLTPPAQQLAQFNNEFEITRDLQISGIRRAIRREVVDQRSALVLEYFEGEPVRKVFRKKGWQLERFLRVAIQAAETLGQIHRSQIIHKDISGNNILVNPQTDELCIIDFGISSRLDEQFEPLSALRDMEGTLPYIAPEQTGRMNRTVDYRADLYSLGVTFYEMLTGHLPFVSDDPVQLVHYHLAQRPKPPHVIAPNVPEMISKIVLRLMEKNAEDRYQSAFGLKTDLERCLN
ncbi:MAG: serine/threonine-protein kinase, partial [Bacteroidota bacterium]